MSALGRPFPKGHVSTHDLSSAGRKSREVSPWGVRDYGPNARRTLRLEAIKRAARKVGP